MATLRLSRRSLALRWFAWVYGADTSRISFCSLFWGLLFSPVAIVLKPFGVGVAALLDRVLDRFVVHSILKTQRTGKTWEQRHPYIDRWIGDDSIRSRLIFLSPIMAIVVIIDAFYRPLAIPLYLGFMAVYLLLTDRLNKRRDKRTPTLLGSAYRSLKSRTCPVIEVN